MRSSQSRPRSNQRFPTQGHFQCARPRNRNLYRFWLDRVVRRVFRDITNTLHNNKLWSLGDYWYQSCFVHLEWWHQWCYPWLYKTQIQAANRLRSHVWARKDKLDHWSDGLRQDLVTHGSPWYGMWSPSKSAHLNLSYRWDALFANGTRLSGVLASGEGCRVPCPRVMDFEWNNPRKFVCTVLHVSESNIVVEQYSLWLGLRRGAIQ